MSKSWIDAEKELPKKSDIYRARRLNGTEQDVLYYIDKRLWFSNYPYTHLSDIKFWQEKPDIKMTKKRLIEKYGHSAKDAKKILEEFNR